jgi:hypothetical protein
VGTQFLKYVGKQDLSVWLEEVTTEPPFLYPYWPVAAGTVLVGVAWCAEKPTIIRPLSKQDAMDMRIPIVLWFVIPQAEYDSHFVVCPS